MEHDVLAWRPLDTCQDNGSAESGMFQRGLQASPL